MTLINWYEKNKTQAADWQSEAGNPAPKAVVIADDTTKADEAYRLACEGTALLYRGDFQNAKQLLQAITRRVDRKPVKPAASLLEAFHQHRARQIGRANITNKVLIELKYGACDLPRAPDVKAAVQAALIVDDNTGKLPARLVLSLRELLGMVGAHEWRKKGVPIHALNANIHAHYGVYSPVRGEYLDLIDQAPLNSPQVAWDIGTGTGVIAAILVARGVKQVVATDNQPRALACATENIQRLNMQSNIQVMQADLFPAGSADLIVCNPPWLPAKANAPIEHAVYDPESKMLKGFLSGLKAHLNPEGEGWLIMSNLAEQIGLRQPEALNTWIHEAGLQVVDKLDIAPTHAKASDQSDPLYAARAKEVTSLYRLKCV
ncbi:class I SAM-dependent methyltransferase [Methylophilus sp. VKM B-3414]|uniref:class I SAM-dependent methyltransferase n=1 Tax=Methylophilus sp. VKM B-3414 TaxID=3076121 RepID=UPI0028C82F7B|nr:class I SAM-dependent methyltransferase [Methylophilus sp. VKM B-3414]MDT7850356.1 class I SAM-dependent methyltransferase [Methylophilus sp. VKM B-3414]